MINFYLSNPCLSAQTMITFHPMALIHPVCSSNQSSTAHSLALPRDIISASRNQQWQCHSGTFQPCQSGRQPTLQDRITGAISNRLFTSVSCSKDLSAASPPNPDHCCSQQPTTSSHQPPAYKGYSKHKHQAPNLPQRSFTLLSCSEYSMPFQPPCQRVFQTPPN